MVEELMLHDGSVMERDKWLLVGVYNRPTHLLASMCVLSSHPKFNAECLLSLPAFSCRRAIFCFVVLLFFGSGDGCFWRKRHGKTMTFFFLVCGKVDALQATCKWFLFVGFQVMGTTELGCVWVLWLWGQPWRIEVMDPIRISHNCWAVICCC